MTDAPIRVEIFDGTIAEFPAGTDPEVIRTTLSQLMLQDKPGGVSTNSDAVAEFEGKADALLNGAYNGVTLGFGDNLTGAISAMGVGQDADGNTQFDLSGTAGERYRRGRDLSRQQYAKTAEAEPGLTMAGNVVGSLGPAALSLPFATGKTALGTIARGMGIGGAEGTAAGVGNADGQNVAQNAMAGGLLGLALGGIAPVATMATRRALNMGGGLLDAAIGRGSQRKANSEIANLYRRSGKTEADIEQSLLGAAQDGQGMYTLMDATGRPGRNAASMIARRGDDGSAEIAEFLERRQLGQNDRVMDYIDDAYPAGEGTVESTVQKLKSDRKATFDPQYDAVRNGNNAPVNVTPIIEDIDAVLRADPSINGGVTGLSETAIGKRLAKIKGQISNGEYQTIDFNQVFETKVELGRTIRAMRKRGEDVPPDVAKVYEKLDAALEASSSLYRATNDGYRAASRVIDAVPAGKKMSTSGRFEDNIRNFEAMTPEEQAAARAGYNEALKAPRENGSQPTSNSARKLSSPKEEAQAEVMAVNPELLSRRVSREKDMWETQNRALRGSQTLDNQMLEQDGAAAAGGAMRAMTSPISTALEAALTRLVPAAKGQTEQTRMMIARMLMSKDPRALQAALREEMGTQNGMRMYDAIARNATRPQMQEETTGLLGNILK